MTTVLLLVGMLFLVLAALKLGDALRDIAFEIREARRMLEKQLASTEKFHDEC
jgi:Sec-independent protein translocase protein TatA